MAKGSYSHKYNPDVLRDLIQQGKTATEIMEKLKISRWSVKEQLLMLQNLDKKYYEVKGLFEERQKLTPAFHQEGIVFSPKMLAKSDFQPGDRFEMIVEKDRIILQKI